MHSRPLNRIHPALRTALEECGAPWSIDNGSRHYKVRVNGRLVASIPRSRGKDVDRALMNVVAQVRRTARGEA